MMYVPVRQSAVDHTGHIIGKLTVLGYLGASTWHCLCECGSRSEIKAYQFKNSSPSCSTCTKVRMRQVALNNVANREVVDTRKHDFSGSSWGTWRVGKYLGNQHYSVVCEVCSFKRSVRSMQIGHKEPIACDECYPSKSSIITPLLLDGMTADEINFATGLDKVNIRGVRDRLVKQGLLEPLEDWDMEFDEIAKRLGVSKSDAVNAYKSGMKKIQTIIGSDEKRNDTLREYLNDAEQRVIEDYCWPEFE